MSNEHKDPTEPLAGFSHEATRQRWELFHRAIAHAKQSNVAALREEHGIDDAELRATLHPIAR